ncbi:unnamed protein product, partial [Ranitomeya imitator]
MQTTYDDVISWVVFCSGVSCARSLEMMGVLIRCLLCLTLCWIHSARSADVLQTPPYLQAKIGQSVSLDCSHADSSFLAKFWYRMKEGKMDRIGYSYNAGEADMEKEFPQEKMMMVPDTPQKTTLQIHSLSPQDSATYYCASSIHSGESAGGKCAEPQRKEEPAHKGSATGGDVAELRLSPGTTHRSLAADVEQTPPLILASLGSTVSMNCSHADSSQNYKYWYRQQTGQALQLLGYAYRTDTATMEVNDQRISMTPDGAQRNTLRISTVSAADRAVYYCASSLHSGTEGGGACAEVAPSSAPW